MSIGESTWAWASNGEAFLAHATPIFTYGLSPVAMCGTPLARYDDPPDTAKAAGKHRCGACKDHLERMGMWRELPQH